jgi:hypothetical protein
MSRTQRLIDLPRAHYCVGSMPTRCCGSARLYVSPEANHCLQEPANGMLIAGKRSVTLPE